MDISLKSNSRNPTSTSNIYHSYKPDKRVFVQKFSIALLASYLTKHQGSRVLGQNGEADFQRKCVYRWNDSPGGNSNDIHDQR